MDIGRLHRHYVDWPPGPVTDYLALAMQVGKKDQRRFAESFPGAKRWLDGE